MKLGVDTEEVEHDQLDVGDVRLGMRGRLWDLKEARKGEILETDLRDNLLAPHTVFNSLKGLIT